MEHLPPVGWADVAQLESRMTRTTVFAVLASNATLAGLAFGAARLA